ncbi:MAG: hypothetical protein F2667_04450 [Actinobacteria bacterium]|nr:hypothetical protein [Actinomycetota bacterium]
MVILTGTPPDPDKQDAAKGEVARRVRTDAINDADPDLCCFDWGVPDGPMPDVNDESIAYATNPALTSGRLNIAEVRRERKLMSPAKFARERYGWWGDPATARTGVIEMSTWAQLRGKAAAPGSAVVVVDVEPDLSASTIGVAANDEESGRALVMVDHRATVPWVVDQVVALDEVRTLLEVALTPSAAMLAPDLEAAGVSVVLLSNTDLGRACGSFQTTVRKGAVLHLGQPELDAAVRTSRTRFVGDLQHWDRRDPKIALSPLVSASVAVARLVLQDDYDVEDSFL